MSGYLSAIWRSCSTDEPPWIMTAVDDGRRKRLVKDRAGCRRPDPAFAVFAILGGVVFDFSTSNFHARLGRRSRL